MAHFGHRRTELPGGNAWIVWFSGARGAREAQRFQNDLRAAGIVTTVVDEGDLQYPSVGAATRRWSQRAHMRRRPGRPGQGRASYSLDWAAGRRVYVTFAEPGVYYSRPAGRVTVRNRVGQSTPFNPFA